jgi:hypothetical protein
MRLTCTRVTRALADKSGERTKPCVIFASMDKDWLGPRGAGEGLGRLEAGEMFEEFWVMAIARHSSHFCQVWHTASPEAQKR